jgi:adenylate cyclase
MQGGLPGPEDRRRLAAILAADVVGYSRLMEDDEVGTARMLREHRAAADPLVAEHGGRIVKTTGDGVLIEFPSVVGAVQCAVALQELAAERNLGFPSERCMEWRIGVHLGDILIDGEDILGDGVNLAARLEGIAEPGGICISEDAFHQVRGKIATKFLDGGEQVLKNITRPVRIYRNEPAAAPRSSVKAAPALPLPDKPSLAVLPFQNMSSDGEQEFFADGIAEDVITALSRYPSLFVIARNSSFMYKGRAVDVKQVGRELGVRYVLEGSLRKAGERIRVTAQLIEAETGNHLWAERYDRSLADIFAVQDEITEAVTIAVAPMIDAAERRRALRKPPHNLDAWAAYQQGLWYLAKATPDSNEGAQRLFVQAIALDPAFAAPHVALARVFGYAGIHYQTMSMIEALRRSSESARKAIEIDPADADAFASLAAALGWQGDMTNALAAARRALALNANCASGQLWVGAFLIMTGNGTEGRSAVEQAKRLSPMDDELADNAFRLLVQSYYFERDYEKSHQIGIHPDNSQAYHSAARALAQLGRTTEARATLTKAAVMGPDAFNPHRRHPFHRPEDHEHLLEGLRKAGWTE